MAAVLPKRLYDNIEVKFTTHSGSVYTIIGDNVLLVKTDGNSEIIKDVHVCYITLNDMELVVKLVDGKIGRLKLVSSVFDVTIKIDGQGEPVCSSAIRPTIGECAVIGSFTGDDICVNRITSGIATFEDK